jgi:hypothetical protein
MLGQPFTSASMILDLELCGGDWKNFILLYYITFQLVVQPQSA